MRIKDQWNEQRIFASRTFAAILIIGLLSLSLLGKLIERIPKRLRGNIHGDCRALRRAHRLACQEDDRCRARGFQRRG